MSTPLEQSDFFVDIGNVESDIVKAAQDQYSSISKSSSLFRIAAASGAVGLTSYYYGNQDVGTLLVLMGTMGLAQVVGTNFADNQGKTQIREPTAGVLYYLFANRGINLQLNRQAGMEALAGMIAGYGVSKYLDK